jgi:hypothetical protein
MPAHHRVKSPLTISEMRTESTEMSVYALKALVNHSLGGDVTTGYVQHSTERLRVPAQRVAD